MHGDQRSLAFSPIGEGVAVLDANAIIDLKQVSVGGLWDLLVRLERRVGDGDICIPREVIDEVGRVHHPDAPGTWAEGMRGRQHHQIEADPQIIKSLLRNMPALLDTEKDHEDADPYVVALAIQLGEDGYDVTVASRDAKPRPGKLSVREACDQLGIRCVPMHEWLVLIGERTVGDAICRKLKL